MGLITNISQVKAYSTINVSNNLPQWQPYLDEAEEIFIKPAIGDDLLKELQEYIQQSTSDDLLDQLLEKVRKPLVLYALNLGSDEMAMSVSGQGMSVVQTDTHKPAPQYMVQNIKENWMRRAHVAMDVLLEFLEKNKKTFASYVSSYNEFFIRNAAEFQKHVDIHSSRRAFLMLLPVISSIEKKYIRPTLSKEYFDELKDAVQSSTPISDDDQAVIDLLTPALAHLTISRALLDVSIDFLDWGIFLTASSTFDNVINKSLANKDRVAAMQRQNQMDGEAELKELQQWLDTNASATRYATYYGSTRCLTDGTEPTKRGEFVNSQDKGIFMA